MTVELTNEKGIWIEKDRCSANHYTTWLDKKRGKVIGFVPFDHSYEPRYLGSVGFLDISRELDRKTSIYFRMGVSHGLLQNQFYPLGGTAKDIHPDLLGKGLAKRIELAIAKDLLQHFSRITPVVIGATSELHLQYCKRLGFVPFKPMTLEEYFGLLNR